MKPLLTFAALAIALLAPARAAEEHPPHAPKETYAPGLGEIMSLQQMRHLKLWLAGAAKNWPLADYELDELKEGFDDMIKFFPVKDDMPIGQMAGSAVSVATRRVRSERSRTGRGRATRTRTRKSRGRRGLFLDPCVLGKPLMFGTAERAIGLGEEHGRAFEARPVDLDSGRDVASGHGAANHDDSHRSSLEQCFSLAHVPAKACPGLDPGWVRVRRQEHAPIKWPRTMV